ncbi:MAG: glycosyltransferase family 4 protein [Candidatus Aminicenantes bacterium]|nr:glycosyltransferase family 4 protein [Candidatus Aminicenantes bacterium]
MQKQPRISVLILSSMFPRPQNPVYGIFVQEQLEKLCSLCDIRAVISPVPYVPPLRVFGRRYVFSQIPKQQSWLNRVVYHPRYPAIPKIFRWLDGYSYFIRIVSLVRSLQKVRDFDILHAHQAFPDGYAAILLGKLFNKPVVTTVHGDDINMLCQRRVLRPMIAFGLTRAKKVIAVSQALRQKVIDLGVKPDRIICIPNAANHSIFYLADKGTARESQCIPVHRAVVLFVGNLVFEKGVQHLLKAVELLQKGGRDVLLIVVGDGTYRPQLEGQTHDYGVQDSVQFVGWKERKDVARLMAACDVLCLPSYREGLPLVVTEAFACGRPVVATNVGGTPEIVGPERGFMVPPGDSVSLADALARALDRTWNSKAIHNWAEQHTLGHEAQEIANLYESVWREISAGRLTRDRIDG